MEETSSSPWLSKSEAARRARVSVRTLERAMHAGELDYSGGGSPGGSRVVIHIDWLDEWVARRRRGKS